MAKKKKQDPVKLPTIGANLSQNLEERRKVPRGLDKRGNISPK